MNDRLRPLERAVGDYICFPGCKQAVGKSEDSGDRAKRSRRKSQSFRSLRIPSRRSLSAPDGDGETAFAAAAQARFEKLDPQRPVQDTGPVFLHKSDGAQTGRSIASFIQAAISSGRDFEVIRSLPTITLARAVAPAHGSVAIPRIWIISLALPMATNLLPNFCSALRTTFLVYQNDRTKAQS
jgi:hypothetical protein